MSNGWTGGQYSVVRIIFGAYLFVHFVSLIPWAKEMFEDVLPRQASPLLTLFPNILAAADLAIPLLIAATLASLLFMAGWFDRIAALAMWYVLACLFGRNPLIANPSLPFAGWLLIFHALLPSAPYLSVAARNRVSPGGGWQMPPAMFGALWMIMSAGYSYSGWTKLISPSWIDGTALSRVLQNPLARPSPLPDLILQTPAPVLRLATWGALGLELLYLPLALWRGARPWIWSAMLLMHIGLLLLIDFADLSFMMIILHLFSFDPAWVRQHAPGTVDLVQYDGTCGLCHSSVRLLLAEDRSSGAFQFAPLKTEKMESVVVQTAGGRLLRRSDAAIHLLRRLGGLWRVISIFLSAMPRSLRDGLYDFVARIRYRVFGRRMQLCPIVPADLRGRFILPDATG